MASVFWGKWLRRRPPLLLQIIELQVNLHPGNMMRDELLTVPLSERLIHGPSYLFVHMQRVEFVLR